MDIGIDIGNTNVTLGFKEGIEWKGMWRMPNVIEEPFTFYRKRWIDELLESSYNIEHISSITISSVVPELTAIVADVAKDVFGQDPVIIHTSLSHRITVNIDSPNELGTDLYANGVAAYHRYNQAVIVVDFGTALTFTSIDKDGTLQGVAIAPGLKTAIKALSGNTAQLPEVKLQTPASPIGKNTNEAIRSGILHGYVGLVKHMISVTKQSLGGDAKCIATGGLSQTLPLLKDEFDDIDVSLTLEGTILIGRENQSR